MLLYGEAKRVLAQYAGRGGGCLTAPGLDLFIREVFEYLLYSGSYQDVRKFTFLAEKGVFTVPQEVDAIQKVKIDDEVGQVWDKWFEYHNSSYLHGDCIPASDALYEEPNHAVTAYDIPACGARVGVMGTCDEDAGANVIVQGSDMSGREIFTVHKGARIHGEYLSIKKGELRYTQNVFAAITGILKTTTNGYVSLFWIHPTTNKRGFLSDYMPSETKPDYRRYRVTSPKCGPYHKVSVLARIKLRDAYADNDRIPFETILTLRLAAQRVNADYNNDIQTADAKDKFMASLIERENSHHRVQNGSPIEIWKTTAPGRIKNIIG